MALNVGPDFKQRWLNAPEAVCEAYLNDLHRVCEVLKPKVDLKTWVESDEKAQQRSLEKIEIAYAELKAKLIEEARIRRQEALEKKLAEKRAEEKKIEQQILQDEELKQIKQTLTLQEIRQRVTQETLKYTDRYSKNPLSIHERISIKDCEIMSDLESLRIRLELEAERLVEQSVTTFRAKLHDSATEEIEYILTTSKFSE